MHADSACVQLNSACVYLDWMRVLRIFVVVNTDFHQTVYFLTVKSLTKASIAHCLKKTSKQTKTKNKRGGGGVNCPAAKLTFFSAVCWRKSCAGENTSGAISVQVLLIRSGFSSSLNAMWDTSPCFLFRKRHTHKGPAACCMTPTRKHSIYVNCGRVLVWTSSLSCFRLSVYTKTFVCLEFVYFWFPPKQNAV